MDLKALKDAVIGSTGVTAPTASPNSTGANAFTQSAIGHIQNLAGINLRGDASKIASNALYGGVSQQATADAANASAAHDAAIKASKDKLDQLQQEQADLADPSKYSRAVNNSGGYDFYAPNGKKITAQDYASVTGKHVTDVIKGSQNTTDQNFLQDYQEVQKLGELTQQGGAALQAYLKKNPDIKKQLDSQGIKTYADVVKNFRSSYPQYFPQSSVNDIGNASYNKTQLQPSGGGFIDKIKSFLGGN
jgi:oligoendopeptidase F